MATDPCAPDLGAIRANLEVFLGQLVTWREMEAGQIRALLAAYDAQAARLAAVARLMDRWTQGAEGGLETLEALEALVDGTDAVPFDAGAVGAREAHDGD